MSGACGNEFTHFTTITSNTGAGTAIIVFAIIIGAFAVFFIGKEIYNGNKSKDFDKMSIVYGVSSCVFIWLMIIAGRKLCGAWG